MTWYRTGNKPLSEPVHKCVTRWRWVKLRISLWIKPVAHHGIRLYNMLPHDIHDNMLNKFQNIDNKMLGPYKMYMHSVFNLLVYAYVWLNWDDFMCILSHVMCIWLYINVYSYIMYNGLRVEAYNQYVCLADPCMFIIVIHTVCALSSCFVVRQWWIPPYTLGNGTIARVSWKQPWRPWARALFGNCFNIKIFSCEYLRFQW